MKWLTRRVAHPRNSGFLTRLARHRGGNTLAIMAAALVPLIGFSGSAIDMARLYVVKARLQQACDAGALAGRKAMSDSNPSTPLDSTAAQQAQTFFKNNFKVDSGPPSPLSDTSGYMQSRAVSFTPTKAVVGTSTVANAVNATATAQVPMAMMQFFAVPTVTESVSCQALYELADSDIMFVLDTTGSMSCAPSDSPSCLGSTSTFTRDDHTTGAYNVEKTSGSTNVSKMEALRQAVLLFDSTMRSNADPSTHFRYGFVTYTSAVNVGAAIAGVSPQYLQAGPTTYQTRTNLWSNAGASSANWDYNYTGNWVNSSGATVTGSQQGSMTNVPQAYCVTQRMPASGYSATGATWNNAGFVMAMQFSITGWTPANGGTCTGTQTPLRPKWHYYQGSIDTTNYLNSIGSGAAVANPSRADGSTMKWRGCIEELNTTASGSFDVNNLPNDLNPDTAPSSPTNKWRPMMPEAEWLRNGTTQDVLDESVNEGSTGQYYNLNYGDGHLLANYEMMSCGMAASRLAVMTAQQVHDYVYDNDFRAWGSTYHDIGMIWGTRMLSPNGVFAADTRAWPNRNPPQRSIVFMTDGTMETFPGQSFTTAYQAYGAEYLDGRVDGGNTGNDAANHTARFRVECDAAKARGITIYAVSLGLAVSSDMTYCASPGQTFQASNTAALSAAFKTIAQRVAELRISK